MTEKRPDPSIKRRTFLAGAGAAAAAAALPKWSIAATPAKTLSTTPHFAPRAQPKVGEKLIEFDIELKVTTHELVPGVKIHSFAYNGTYPGPELRVTEGDWVRVNFTNRSPEIHTIHWHGITLANEMDGVPNGTQWGVAQDQTFTYLFQAQPAGTHFYHCHNMTQLHVQAGMFGILIIEPKNDPIQAQFPYTRDYTLALSEVDTRMVERDMERMMRDMGTMQKMSDSPKLMSEMNGLMMGWFKDKKEFERAMKEGYVPPYLSAKRGAKMPANFDYFLINGKAFPSTDPLWIQSGENIRVRLIGAGANPHYMHLHGHDFWHVAQDGHPLPNPMRLNTIPVFPGNTSDIIVQGTNPGMWHFHDHSDLSNTNNGVFPGGMMTMLMYEDMEEKGVKIQEVLQVSS